MRRALLAIVAACGLGIAQAQEAAKAEGLRPEVGKPLQAAQDHFRAQRFEEALAKVREADAVSGKTPYESFIIERMRGVAAAGAGDLDGAGKALDAAVATGRLSDAEKLKLIESLTGTAYRLKDYARAITWGNRYFQEGGTNAAVRTVLAQAYYLHGDFANTRKEVLLEIQAAGKAGVAPTEDKLRLLASASLKLGDNAGYLAALEKLVAHYPKKDYWADLIARVRKTPGFAERLALDVHRLSLATGTLAAIEDYVEMVQLAIQAALPTEALKVASQGYAVGALGAGADAERHKRMRDLAARQVTDDQKAMAKLEADVIAARDGAGLMNLGYALVAAGEFDRGLKLMEQGMAKGVARRPDDARLHLGIAYYLAGRKAQAVPVFKAVQGTDGTAELARLWALLASRP